MDSEAFWGSVGSGRWGWVLLSVWGALEKSVDLSRKAQKAVPVAFDGAIPPSTAGMAIVDGHIEAFLSLPARDHSIVQLAKGKSVKDTLYYEFRYVIAWVHGVCGNRCMEVKEGSAPPWLSLCFY